MNQNPAIAAAAKEAMKAVTKEAAKSTNKLSEKAVADAAPALEVAMEKAIAASPAVQNATNTEAHFYQKRSFWATVGATGAGLTAAVAAFADYMSTRVDSNEPLSYVTIAFALWAGYSAFRAGRAQAPLGASNPAPRYPLNKG